MQPLPLCLKLVLVTAVAQAAKSGIPHYIQVCKRNDPRIEQCILNSVENLRPKLKTGIPELDVPGLEPLILPEVDVSRGTGVKAKGTNVTIHGASNFKILSLKADMQNFTFYIKLVIPFLTFNAQYNVNARILVIPIKGQGNVRANASDVMGDVILKGRKIKRDGDIYTDFSIKLKLDISNYEVQLDNLFNGNKDLGRAVNNALNMNKREFMNTLRPIVEKTVSNVLLEIAKKITKNFTYDELFPL